MPTKIAWTGESWNPVTGCVPISPGCAHCYARTFAERFRGASGPFSTGFDIAFHEDRLDRPKHWRKPRMVFAGSMTDLFGDFVPDAYLDQIFAVMRQTPQHTYQVLTKRARRLLTYTKRNEWLQSCPNVWLGVSVENRRHGLPRIDLLRQAPAALRFISVEPLLEDLGPLDLSGISWVIAGGESGPGFRPMDPVWVRSIKNHCRQLKIPFFFQHYSGLHPQAEQNLLDGKIWHQFPQQN